MRGDRESFDMVPPPDDGGRSVDDAVIVRPGGGERYERANRTITILGDEPQFSAFDIGFDESFHVDPHEHDDQADSFFVLEGEVEFTVGDDVVHAGPGTWLSAPPGARHGFGNGGSGRARVLNVHAPDAGFAAWIRDQNVRLGYACVNTQLPSSARTVRLANATPERLRELIAANLDALEAILRWNAEHDIAVFRLTSNLIPLASHPGEHARVVGRVRAIASTSSRALLADAGRADLDASRAVHGAVVGAAGGGGRGDRGARVPRPAARGARTRPIAQDRAARRLGSGRSGGGAREVRGRVRAACPSGARERLVLENDERWPLDRVLELAGAARASPSSSTRSITRSRRRSTATPCATSSSPPARRGATATAVRRCTSRRRSPASGRARTRRRSSSTRSPRSPPRSATCRSTASSR